MLLERLVGLGERRFGLADMERRRGLPEGDPLTERLRLGLGDLLGLRERLAGLRERLSPRERLGGERERLAGLRERDLRLLELPPPSALSLLYMLVSFLSFTLFLSFLVILTGNHELYDQTGHIRYT